MTGESALQPADGEHVVAVLGAPCDGGTSYRPGTRFEPQGTGRCLDAAFVPGTGWPGPGGFLPARKAGDDRS